MSVAHTAGPWQTGHAGTTNLWVGPGYDKQPVALVPWDTDEARDDATARANARLIAAAPDLLAALRGLLGMPSDYEPGDHAEFGYLDVNARETIYQAQYAAWQVARAAIAKATGA